MDTDHADSISPDIKDMTGHLTRVHDVWSVFILVLGDFEVTTTATSGPCFMLLE